MNFLSRSDPMQRKGYYKTRETDPGFDRRIQAAGTVSKAHLKPGEPELPSPYIRFGGSILLKDTKGTRPARIHPETPRSVV